MTNMTQLLSDIDEGRPQASEELLPLVYGELRRLAAQRMANENPGQTLDATGLVHEAYLRLVDRDRAQQWNGRGHFYAAAAEAMRRILIERARHKNSLKAGGAYQRQSLATDLAAGDENLLEIHDVLDKLERLDARKATVVKLLYFIGMTLAEAADVLGVSKSTAENDWAFARAWLKVELDDRTPSANPPAEDSGFRAPFSH